jgi:Uma2 family endonuclease
MSMQSRVLLSDEEFLRLPDIAGKRELLDGELIDLPPAKWYHSVIAKKLIHLLATVLDESRVWIEIAYWLRDGRWLIPDVSVSWPDQRRERGWYKGSPMLAIEIASRGNTAAELESKTALYLEQGAAEVWVLYPKTQTIVVSRPHEIQRIAPGGAYRCELLDLTVISDFWVPEE